MTFWRRVLWASGGPGFSAGLGPAIPQHATTPSKGAPAELWISDKQTTQLNLGSHFDLPQPERPALAQRIEQTCGAVGDASVRLGGQIAPARLEPPADCRRCVQHHRPHGAPGRRSGQTRLAAAALGRSTLYTE